MEKDTEELERRLAALEARVRSQQQSLRLLGGGLVAAVAALVLVGGSRPAQTQEEGRAVAQTVRAPFRVLDSRGKLLFEVNTNLTGVTLDGQRNVRGSATHNALGKPIGGTGAIAQGQRMVTFQPNGRQGMLVGSGTQDSGTDITLNNSSGQKVAGIGANDAGYGHVSLKDAQGHDDAGLDIDSADGRLYGNRNGQGFSYPQGP